ncbi:hypothetical protein CO037_02780 [Candidatus Pacearchaeota archaeon CG_4_9_14_0_2_um_filter_30_8]|nr:MAG: hypothetical protein CO037_02780 [Candidatus Pacearchaeota archaeon CG_4_9_14_0_2_um_filter_30_8]
MEGVCSKCNYKGDKNIRLFGVILCDFCAYFAPEEKTKFFEYLSEKVNFKDIETFRRENRFGNSKQKKGMIKKAKEGKVVSRAPFGYKIVENKLVKAENWGVVENIFLEFQDNKISLNKLSKKYGFSVNGMKKILRNFTYLGKIKFDGEVHEGNHEPILSSTLFNHVQDKLERLGIK